MTAQEAATFLESLPPVTIKLKRVDLLEWQAKRGLSVVHLNWYIRKLQEPKMSQESLSRLRSLTQTVGRTDHG